jgi:hypothetical protein
MGLQKLVGKRVVPNAQKVCSAEISPGYVLPVRISRDIDYGD